MLDTKLWHHPHYFDVISGESDSEHVRIRRIMKHLNKFD